MFDDTDLEDAAITDAILGTDMLETELLIDAVEDISDGDW